MYTSTSGNANICLDYFYACTGVQLDETAVPYPVYDGTVTIEARVKRTKDAGQYNQFSMYSFNSSKFSSTSPTGDNTTLTFYMVGNKINTHTTNTAEVMSYETNKWYDLKIVADFDTGKFDFYVDDIKKLENQSFKKQRCNT